MVCIYCQGSTQITNSRPLHRIGGTWRRHRCTRCDALFTSIERADYATSLAYQPAASHIVPFDRDRLLLSLYEACRHRPTAIQDAAALADTVINKLLRSSRQTGLVERDRLVATVLATLKAFDRTAQVYYAAYHKA